MDDDFSLNGTAGKWNLNLHMFIYDVNGNLVDKAEQTYTSLASTLSYDVTLDPGKYTIVSVADFDGTYNGTQYKFWNISDEQDLNDLKIQESETVCSSAMETLGIDVETIEVSNKTLSVNIDIKPVTGLVEMIIWDDDFSNAGKDGYSFNAPYINDLTIFSQQLKQIVKFEDGNITYDYGIQAVRYPMTTHSPRAQAANGASKQSLSYRALLPDDDKKFYWELNTIPGAGKYLFTDGKDSQTSDLTDNSVNIESGKQYVMDLILDRFYLLLDDYDSSVDMFSRLDKYFDKLNTEAINKVLGKRYDYLMGKSKSYIDGQLGTPYSVSGTSVTYFGSDFVTIMMFNFEDETLTKCTQGVMSWSLPNDKMFNKVDECLSKIYTPWNNGTTDTKKNYINADVREKASAGIVWEKRETGYYMSFVALQ